MKILAIEFSSSQRSVAVVDGSSARSFEVSEAGSRAAHALQIIDTALTQAKLEREQIECLAVGIGPGSYTGIRSAISLAQGWSLAREVRLLGLGSVECLAAQAQREGLTGRVDVVVDAQRGEFYVAAYELTPQSRKEVAPLRIVSREEIAASERAGAALVGPEINHWFPEARALFPRAATLGELAAGRTDFVAGENLAPIYLREITFVKAPPPRAPL